MVNSETGRYIGLAVSRDLSEVTEFLKGFSGAITVSRDGSITYKKAISDAIPFAEQISDRFHLVKNLIEAASGYFARIIPFCIVPPRPKANELGIVGKMTSIERKLLAKYRERQNVFRRVKTLQATGKRAATVVRETCLTESMVRKYFKLDELPLHRKAMTERICAFTPFMPQILQMVRDGFRGIDIIAAVRLAGCKSADSRIKGYISRIKRDGVDRTEQKFFRRDICKLLYRPPEKIRDERLRDKVLKYVFENPQVALVLSVVNEFREVLKSKNPDALDDWLLKVKTLKVKELTGFVHFVENDLLAVKNSIAYAYSNGIAEGKINKLKTIKRQTYGRAGFELLASRLFLADACGYVE